MSVQLNLTQKSRPYKIEIYSLQDDYLGTLQAYNDSFIGQVIEPYVEILDDGSQTFTCSIPKFYINPENNLKVENPRWTDINNGILAENTRILKVFMHTLQGKEIIEKVYPFIIDTIIDKRDTHYQAYREITGSGLAFSELGKQGYKIELSTTMLINNPSEEEAGAITTIDYWLDKVFPNKIINGRRKWLTKWCYEIRMDWSHYSDPNRLSNKIYEDSYVSSWGLSAASENTAEQLVPKTYEVGQEKARSLEIINSNKYNITQTIAEQFGVFCVYEYLCDERGQFISEYTDEQGNVWTGRKVVFYNRAIKADNPLIFDYQKNLASISRTAESADIYTKLYVTPIESDSVGSGLISIADTSINPLMEDYILNFDYLYETGGIIQYQYNQVKRYESTIHKLNKALSDLSPKINDLEVEINDSKTKIALLQKSIDSLKEEHIHYETLKNNDVTNEPVKKDISNPCPIVFISEQGGSYANLRLEGIDQNSIIGYSDYYETSIFGENTSNKLVITTKKVYPSSGNQFFLLLDDYGFPCQIYTAQDVESVYYLELTYSPQNAYEKICENITKKINSDQIEKEKEEKNLEALEEKLDILINGGVINVDGESQKVLGQQDYLAQKEEETIRLERILGPALREGYWNPDESYKDPGEKIDETVISPPKSNIEDTGVAELFWDTVSFEDEETGYYYEGVLDNNEKKYYPYMVLTNEEFLNSNNINNLVIHLSEPNREEGVYLEERLIYEKAGFIFACIKQSNNDTVVPVLLFNDNTINYSDYNKISYSYLGETATTEPIEFNLKNEEYTLVYPRIYIGKANVQYQSDLFKVEVLNNSNEETTELIKYEDYTILTRKGKPYITFKIRNSNPIGFLFNSSIAYKLSYRVSRASEMLYLDAKEVARENSRPRYSYEVEIANTPDNIAIIDLGQLAYINDHSLSIHAATGYVTSIGYDLANPQSDKLTIQNYKTKFEDLFSTITASSEAIKNNSRSYNIAANAFNSNGQLSGDVLQTAIDSNNIHMNFSDTNIEMSPTDGIILTNSSPYLNGVYGQVALRGGGIFLSNAVDNTGERIWNTGITPQGINASLITAGRIDTNNIRIFSGDNMAFQWNSEGIFAYTRDENGTPNLSKYVKYSDKGLQYVDGDNTIVDLGWNGLLISTQDGSTELTGDKGLVVYYGEKNNDGTNYAARLGKFDDGTYGLRLYNKVEDEYIPNLVSSNKGELWLKNTLRVGSEIVGGVENLGIAGITGEGEANGEYSPVRFWAGSSNRENAPFWVREDGSFKATKAIIEGNINATTGSIGGWDISGNTISSDGIILQAADKDNNIPAEIKVSGENGNVTISSDGSLVANGAVVNGTINASGGTIGNLEIADVNNLAGDVSIISIRLTTMDSLAYKTGSQATITTTAEALRGNIPFTLNEYNNGINNNGIITSGYSVIWYKSDDNQNWTPIKAVNIKEGQDIGDIAEIIPYPIQTLEALTQSFTFSVDQPIYINCKLIPFE